MKYALFTLLAALTTFSACKKQECATPTTSNQTVSDAELNDGRAILISGANKRSEDGLEMEYDLVIKEVSEHKYSAKLKMKGLNLDGKKVKDFKPKKGMAVVIGLNTTKEEGAVPLAVELKSNDEQGDTYLFPVFEYKGDLAFELVDVTTSVTVYGNWLLGGTPETASNDDHKVEIGGVNITVPASSINIIRGNFIVYDYATVLFNNVSTTTSFAILFSGKAGDHDITLRDRETFFVLGSGHTEAQKPEVAKVKVKKEDNGTYGYVTITIAGDPAKQVSSIYYKPNDITGSNTKETTELPVMKFVATHYNQKNGVQRFVSAQTWDAVYGKTPIALQPDLHKGVVFGTVLGFAYGLQYD